MDGTLPTFRGCRFQGHWYIGDLLNHLYICFKVTKILANPNQVWFSLSNREIQLQFTLTDPNTYSEPSQHILLSRMVYSSRLTSSTNMFISWNYTIFLCTRSIIVVSVQKPVSKGFQSQSFISCPVMWFPSEVTQCGPILVEKTWDFLLKKFQPQGKCGCRFRLPGQGSSEALTVWSLRSQHLPRAGFAVADPLLLRAPGRSPVQRLYRKNLLVTCVHPNICQIAKHSY